MNIDQPPNAMNAKVFRIDLVTDIHRLDLPHNIIDLLLLNGVYYIRQVEHMGESELAMMPGLGPITASKIEAAFYRCLQYLCLY
jgi:hypothetical protein